MYVRQWISDAQIPLNKRLSDRIHIPYLIPDCFPYSGNIVMHVICDICPSWRAVIFLLTFTNTSLYLIQTRGVRYCIELCGSRYT